MSTDDREQVEYFYNVRTRMVEKGRLSSWEDLMGQYATPEEAEHALETARKRNDAWADEDAEWRGDED